MRLQARKLCARGDQGIDGTKITLQVVELVAYSGFYLAAAWLLLFVDIEESSACPPTIISGSVFTKFLPLAAEIINDPFCGLTRLVQQLQVSWKGDLGWRTRGIVAKRSPVLVLRPIYSLHKFVE
jgi:hypothetical protein